MLTDAPESINALKLILATPKSFNIGNISLLSLKEGTTTGRDL
jgi:hypothetical protein